MPPSPRAPVVRPATGRDLGALQELARRTIDARYRSFLGDDGVNWFISSGASDDHIESHFRQGPLESEGPGKIEFVRSRGAARSS